MLISIELSTLIPLFKIHLERDKLWLKENPCTNLISPIWNIIADYCVDDPAIVDRIVEMGRANRLCEIGDLSFSIEIHRWINEMKLRIYADQTWTIDDINIFAALLDMPQFYCVPYRDGMIQYANYIVTIRRYLYGDIRADYEHADESD